jgi:hypothetical protein
MKAKATADYAKYRAELKAATDALGVRPVSDVRQELHDQLITRLTSNVDPAFSDEEAEKILAYYVALSRQDSKESP